MNYWGLKLVLRAQPHNQFLKWYKTFSWLFGSHDSPLNMSIQKLSIICTPCIVKISEKSGISIKLIEKMTNFVRSPLNYIYSMDLLESPVKQFYGELIVICMEN